MKTLLLIAACFIILASCAPAKHAVNTKLPSPYEFTLIDSVKGAKDELFVKANEWVAKSFVDAKSVIQMHDKEAGKIIAKGVMTVNTSFMLYTLTNHVSYTATISIKEGKYKIVLDNFELFETVTTSRVVPCSSSLDKTSSPCIQGNQWDKIRWGCYSQAQNFLLSFKSGMKKQTQDF